jgi:asparagine synthase (glutamine-hydrolysing)
MCGIAGAFGRTAGGQHQLVDDLLECMVHRGPDGQSTSADSWHVLGHNRLAINDLSPTGEQPFTSSSGAIVCIYNGEIYNHYELRSTFGISTQSSCDGAMLPDLWDKFGAAALNRLRGMYSLAVIDLSTRTLTLAADPFGVKPCYWAAHDGNVVFASESRSLACLIRNHEPATSALASFLLSGSVPAHVSAHEGINRVVPGTWIRFDLEGGILSGPIVPDAKPNAHVTYADVADGLRESVRAHLLSDVPVGLLLSGGVDSIAVAVAAREAGQQLHCLTVDFGDTDGGEGSAAAVAAKELGADHSIVRTDPTSDDIEGFFAAMDRPTVDGLNTYLACQAVAAQGLKVVLTGAGGDETLGGGYRHHRLGWVARASPSVLATASAAMATHHAWMRIVPEKTVSGMMSVGWPTDSASLVAFARTLRHDRETTQRILALEPIPRFDDSAIRRLGCASHGTALLWAETEQYLMSQLLPDSDAFSMAHGVELRVPFVDVPFAAAAWCAPSSGRHAKKLFADSFGSSLVERAAARPKRSFGVPMDSWMRVGPLEPFVREAECRNTLVGELLGVDLVQGTIQRWRDGRAHWSTAWSVTVLEAWMKRA